MQTFTLELGAGERIVGDHLPGTSPGYLFLHGLGSVRAGEKSTSLMAHAKARGRACTRFDFRGHGASSGTIGQVAVSELIADTLRVLERFGPAIVVGSSLGGLVGAFAAARRPDLVSGLALLAPALGFLADLGAHTDADGRMWTNQGLGFVLSPRVIADASTLDERGLPALLRAPTLVVHGTADDTVSVADSERFFAAIPGAKKALWIVPGGDHRLNTFVTEIWARLDALLGQ
jgi:pimeloyl-ACP methyl ester carboxylesterase